MIHYEITINGGITQALEKIARANINILAQVIGPDGNRIVLDYQGKNDVLNMGLNIVCVSTVLLVPAANMPGGLLQCLRQYQEFDIVSLYVGHDNNMVLKFNNGCIHYT